MSSSIPAEVFELSRITDNEIFEGFAFKVPPYSSPSLLGRDSFEDDINPGYETSKTVRLWRPVKLKSKWKAPQVIGRVAPFNDYPCVDISYPVFSRRACKALRDFLVPNGELLPVKSDCGEYYFYNVTTVADALNVEKSKCHFWTDRPMTASSIDRFEFHPNQLNGLSIFRIVDWPGVTLVTREFVDRILQQGLNGFRFRKVWPLARNVNWRMVDHDSKERKEAKALSAHTLVLILPLAGKKPARAESKQIKRFEAELDAQLTLKFFNARYFGTYAGIDTVDKECRLFIQCPDVEVLVKKLAPWLRNLSWPRTAYLMKRYGDMHDEDAKEVVLELTK